MNTVHLELVKTLNELIVKYNNKEKGIDYTGLRNLENYIVSQGVNIAEVNIELGKGEIITKTLHQRLKPIVSESVEMLESVSPVAHKNLVEELKTKNDVNDLSLGCSIDLVLCQNKQASNALVTKVIHSFN